MSTEFDALYTSGADLLADTHGGAWTVAGVPCTGTFAQNLLEVEHDTGKRTASLQIRVSQLASVAAGARAVRASDGASWEVKAATVKGGMLLVEIEFTDLPNSFGRIG